MLKRREDLTFQHNLKHGRHGWLRLTPAYSVKVVHNILDAYPAVRHVLDPFSGTGTTGLVCAERGIACTLLDINPFLVWLARVKTTHYTHIQLRQTRELAEHLTDQAAALPADGDYWTPAIHRRERWGSPVRLNALARLYACLSALPESPVRDLLLIAFCRVVIEWSNAAFNHQSMSFKAPSTQLALPFDAPSDLYQPFMQVVADITHAAGTPLLGTVRTVHADARQLALPQQADCVITSPPYPNRMSYIRELRPYMYWHWLGYLTEARQAGELDWQAIGGTWGIATSRLTQWQHQGEIDGLMTVIEAVQRRSPLLANYLHKYFEDIGLHLKALHSQLADATRLFYVVGNSKFYDTLVPVDVLYRTLFEQNGYRHVQIEVLRKRNSKKELVEYLISCQK